MTPGRCAAKSRPCHNNLNEGLERVRFTPEKYISSNADARENGVKDMVVIYIKYS